MFIESIELSDYRNYSHLHIDFHKGTNVLYGDNAQGKTNILEAVYVCSTTKSHRGSKDKEIIRFGADESHIKMMVRRDGIPYRIDMHLKKNKAKGVAVNGVPIKKASELFGIVNVIFFSPEDLNIIKNGPAERRRFVDLELCQLNRLYVYNLAQYNKTVIQRNKLLKDIDYNTSLKETLPMWNEQLLKYGTELIIMRSEFIKELRCLSSLFTFRNILFHQAVQCAFHLYHNVHQPVVLFAKPLVFFFQSIFAMSLHAHCFRPPYASSAAALSCVHFLLLKYIIHFPAIEKWFLNASFDMVRRTHDMHGQSSAPQDSCCPQMADLVQQRNQYKKECALAHSRASRGRLRQSTSSRECASLAR